MSEGESHWELTRHGVTRRSSFLRVPVASVPLPRPQRPLGSSGLRRWEAELGQKQRVSPERLLAEWAAFSGGWPGLGGF